MATPSQPEVELDELRLLIVVENETDTLSSIDEGVPQMPEVANLITRVHAAPTLWRQGTVPGGVPGRRCATRFPLVATRRAWWAHAMFCKWTKQPDGRFDTPQTRRQLEVRHLRG